MSPHEARAPHVSRAHGKAEATARSPPRKLVKVVPLDLPNSSIHNTHLISRLITEQVYDLSADYSVHMGDLWDLVRSRRSERADRHEFFGPASALEGVAA